MLIPSPDIHHTIGHSKRFMIPTTRINCYKHSFYLQFEFGISYPQQVIEMTEIKQFKVSLAGLETVLETV